MITEREILISYLEELDDVILALNGVSVKPYIDEKYVVTATVTILRHMVDSAVKDIDKKGDKEMSKTKQTDVVTELLARVGEMAVLDTLSASGEIKAFDINYIPDVSVSVTEADDTKQAVVIIYDIDEEPRRLVLIPGIGWCWYNAEGPEE